MQASSVLNSFIREHQSNDVNLLALQRDRYRELTDAEFRFALQQIEGRQRMKTKLPQLSQLEEWQFPVRISLEQCSSEQTALYKVSILKQLASAWQIGYNTLIDLTGGFGIDCFYMSELFKQTYYIEHNKELCETAEHNFKQTQRNIEVCNCEAGEFIIKTELFVQSQNNAQKSDYQLVIYIDPARRSSSGSKVFRLEDCEPNILEILPIIRGKADIVLIKLSPMLDIAEIIRKLQPAEIHVVSIGNEVKEVLALLSGETPKTTIKAINLDKNGNQVFEFEANQEAIVHATILADANDIKEGSIVYEPGAAIMKAGAFNYISQKFGVKKFAVNTHLYLIDGIIPTLVDGFVPTLFGRYYRVVRCITEKDLRNSKDTYASVMCRNYPNTADALKKKYRIKDDDKQFIIGCTIGTKAILLLTERIQ